MSFHWTICFQCSLNPFHKEIILPWKNLDSRQLASIIWRCLTWFIKFMIFFFKILHFDSFFPFLLRHASSTFFFLFWKIWFSFCIPTTLKFFWKIYCGIQYHNKWERDMKMFSTQIFLLFCYWRRNGKGWLLIFNFLIFLLDRKNIERNMLWLNEAVLFDAVNLWAFFSHCFKLRYMYNPLFLGLS